MSDSYKSSAWKTLRKKILLRDGKRCQTCGSRHILHVHHKKYTTKIGHETDLTTLITLCEKCHAKEHNKQPILRLPKRNWKKNIQPTSKSDISIPPGKDGTQFIKVGNKTYNAKYYEGLHGPSLP